MAYLGVLAIAIANSALLFFASFLAAGGDGSADGIYRVRFYGFTWIGICTVAALVCCARKRSAAGISVAVSTLPAAWALALVVIFAGSALGLRIE